MARTFLKELINMCGAAARAGYEMANDNEVTMETPAANFTTRSSSVRSSTSGLKTEPLSYTDRTTSPYENGLIPSFARRAASEEPTLSPFLISSTGVIISTVPLLILVGMFSTWNVKVLSHNFSKKERPIAESRLQTWKKEV